MSRAGRYDMRAYKERNNISVFTIH